MPVGTEVGQPPWQHLSGVKRIASEFKYLRRCIHEGKIGQINNLNIAHDNIAVWQFELSNFDESVPAGQQLNSDLKQLQLQYGQGFLLMEVTFPEAYPHKPLFLRVVSPRCVWYTGHVTAGGAICLEVLTNTGSSNGWRPDFCVESILQLAILNMLHTESVVVKTASGPGGRSGPLRLDLQSRHSSNIMQPYSMAEAKSAFARMLRHHQANGWDSSPASQAVSEPSRPAMSRPSMHRNSKGGPTAASASSAHAAETSQQPAACDKDCTVMHRDHHSTGPSAPSLAQAGSASVSCPPANHQENLAAKPWYSSSHATAGPDVLPLGTSSSSPLLPPAPDQHATATATDAEASCFGNCDATLQSAVDLTDSPGDSAASQQQIGIRASAAVRAPNQPTTACPGSQPAYVRHSGNDLMMPGSDTKRSGLPSEPCRKVEFAEQRAQEHAEVAVSLEGVRQELMTLDGSSSMLDSDSLIDLTDDMEDVPGGLATGVFAAPAVQGPLAEPPAPTVAVTSIAAAVAAASSGPVAASASASAATSAEAARMKELEAKLAEFQAQSTILQAQNMRLTSELEKAQQLSLDGARMASLVQPPSNWQAHAQGQALLYIELPVSEGAKKQGKRLSDIQLKAHHKGWFYDMSTNQINMSDALAALRKHNGDEEAALQLILESLSNGGVANYLKLLDCTQAPSRPMKPVADACDRELEAETEMVMQLWEEHGGLGRHQITGIRRVQNMSLWTKYALTRAEIQQARPELSNGGEMWLFHGAHKTCIEAIVTKGFDTRVSNRGMLGQGIYFANCSAYSDRYARYGPERAAGMPALWPGGPGGYVDRIKAAHQARRGALNQQDRPGLQQPQQQQALSHQGPNQGQLWGAGRGHPQASQQPQQQHALLHQGPNQGQGHPQPAKQPQQQHVLLHQGVGPLLCTGPALPPSQHAAASLGPLGGWSDSFASARAAALAAAGSRADYHAAYISSLAGRGHDGSRAASLGGPPADPGVIQTSGAHPFDYTAPHWVADRPGHRPGSAGSSTHGQAMDPDGARGGHGNDWDRHNASSAPPANRPFTRPARNSLAPTATDAAVGNPVSDGDAHAQVVGQLLAFRNRSQAFWSPDTQFTQAAQAVPEASVSTAAAAARSKPDDTATILPAESAPGSPTRTSSLRRRDISMEEHRQQVRRVRCKPWPEVHSPSKASAGAIVAAAMAKLAAITPAVSLPDPQDFSKAVPPADGYPQTSAWAPKAHGVRKNPPSGSQGGTQADPLGSHVDAHPPLSMYGTQNRFSGFAGGTKEDPVETAAAMPPPAPHQPIETTADAAHVLASLSSGSQDMHGLGADLPDLPDLGEVRPRKQRVKLGDPGSSKITGSFRQVCERAVATDPSDLHFQDLLHDCAMFSSADKVLALSGTHHAKRKRSADSAVAASKQQGVPAGLSSPPSHSTIALTQTTHGHAADHAEHGRHVTDTDTDTARLPCSAPVVALAAADSAEDATTAMGHPTRQGSVNMEECKAAAQHGDGLASARHRVAVRRVPVKTCSASMANPGAEAHQPNVTQADKTPRVAAATAAATASEGQQQHKHMPASSAVAPEPNQARPNMPAAPLVTSSSSLQAEARAMAGVGWTARRFQQVQGLPQGAEPPPGSHQGHGEGHGPAKKLKQAVNSRNLEAELRPQHAYRLRNRAVPTAASLGQKPSQDGLQPNGVNSVAAQHDQGQAPKGIEEGQGSGRKGSGEGGSGKETRANKGNGERRGKRRGDRHGRGKGTSGQLGAASDGPAGAVMLGSALDAAANEVTSRAGPQLPASPPHQVPQPAPHPVPPPAAPKLAAAPSTAATLQQSAGDATGGEELTILLSRVALGSSTRGSMILRRPPEGYDSTNHFVGKGGNKLEIYCIYDNAQAYPDYIITYKAKRPHGAR